MNSFELLATRPTQQKGSTFQGFAVYASKLLGVSLAYSKVRITVPKARHIMCAYNMAGMRDSCDDGEDHAGILIEKMLHAQNLSGVAVFIARETGPDQLGQLRFEIIRKLVQELFQILQGAVSKRPIDACWLKATPPVLNPLIQIDKSTVP